MKPKGQTRASQKRSRGPKRSDHPVYFDLPFSTVMGFLPGALVTIDNNFCITGWNPASEQIYGWKAEEVLGKPIEEFLKTEFLEGGLQQSLSQIEALGFWSGEVIQRRKDGTRIYVHSSVSVVNDRAGRRIGLLGINYDISDKKQAERMLYENESRHAHILDTLMEGCQIIDFDWRYIYVNNAAARHGRIPKEALLNHTMMEMYPGIEKTGLYVVLKDCMQNRVACRMENEFRYPDGSTGWFELNIEPIPEGLFILSIDITERKLSEIRLRESEERFRELVNNIQEALWITDPLTGQEIYLSPAVESIWGKPPVELMERSGSFLEQIFPEDKPLVLQALSQQKRGERTSIEYRVIKPDGSICWVWDRAFPMMDADGKTRRVAGLASDITERKLAEERIRLQVQRLNALRLIDTAINSSLSLELTLNIFLKEARSQLQVDAVDILLFKPGMNRLEFAVGEGFVNPSALQGVTWQISEGIAGRVALRQEMTYVPDTHSMREEFQRADFFKRENFVSYVGLPLIAKGNLIGVFEAFNKTPLEKDEDWFDYLKTLAGQAAIAINNSQLFEKIQKTNFDLTIAYDATIIGWSRAMDLRDKETEGHTQRVTELTLKLAKKMGIAEQELVHIRRGALLHDIGKLGVPDHILLKPDKLDAEEWEIMRRHPVYAYEMLLPIQYLKPALDIPYCHHEKWDGTGYPRGLKGADIPLAARIFAIVDVWDALRSDRPYRPGWSAEKTLDYIRAESGKHFDPDVVKNFLELL